MTAVLVNCSCSSSVLTPSDTQTHTHTCRHTAAYASPETNLRLQLACCRWYRPWGICPFTKVMRLRLPLFMDLLLEFLKHWMHPGFLLRFFVDFDTAWAEPLLCNVNFAREIILPGSGPNYSSVITHGHWTNECLTGNWGGCRQGGNLGERPGH